MLSLNKNLIKFLVFNMSILALTFSFYDHVKADSLQLGVPRGQVMNMSGAYSQRSVNLVGWWGSNNYYSIDAYIGGYSTAEIYQRNVYTWSNANLCQNKMMTISGSVGGLTGAWTHGNRVAIFNNGTELTCSSSITDSGSRWNYTCTGMGGGTYEIFVLMDEYTYNGLYSTAVSRSVDITCNATNNDVIQNQNNNTQNVINNNNQNTQNIINNNNQNTQDIINNFNDNNIDDSEVGGYIGQMQNMFGIDTNIITQLFILPFNIINAIFPQTGHECYAYHLGNLFGTNLIMPCINIKNVIGSALYNTIDVIFAGIISLGFVFHLKKILNEMLTLSENFDKSTDIQIMK